MAKFDITWHTLGTEETVEQSDCETVEQYIQQRFGDTFDAEKVSIKLSGATEPKIETKVKTTNKSKSK